MCELPVLVQSVITEADGIGQLVDVALLADQTMKSVAGTGPVVLFDHALALHAAQGGGFGGIDAHEYEREIRSGVQRHLLGGIHQRPRNDTAQLGAGIITQLQNDRLARREILTQLHNAAVFVKELKFHWNLSVGMLVNSDVLILRGKNVNAGRIVRYYARREEENHQSL